MHYFDVPDNKSSSAVRTKIYPCGNSICDNKIKFKSVWIYAFIQFKIFINYGGMKGVATVSRCVNIGIPIFVTTKWTVVKIFDICLILIDIRMIRDSIHVYNRPWRQSEVSL